MVQSTHFELFDVIYVPEVLQGCPNICHLFIFLEQATKTEKLCQFLLGFITLPNHYN